MRISTDPKSSAYKEDALSTYKIRLNGHVVWDWITADTDTGFVELLRWEYDKYGHYGQHKRKLYGVVKINRKK